MPKPKSTAPQAGGPRRGVGAGHGGPAKGEGNRGAGPGRGITHRSVAEIMAAAEAREIAAAAWMVILRDPSHPKHADMVMRAAERLDGAPKQSMDMSMRDAPLDDLTDDELARIVDRGRREAARAASGEE